MKVNPIGAEARAVEEGLKARYQPDGTFLVACRHPEVCGVKSHHISLEGIVYDDDSIAIRFRCDCPSGTSRPGEDVPCYHAAAAGRWLERRHLAGWTGGTWYARGALHDELGNAKQERLASFKAAYERKHGRPFDLWEKS